MDLQAKHRPGPSGRGDLNPRPPAPKAGALPLRHSPVHRIVERSGPVGTLRPIPRTPPHCTRLTSERSMPVHPQLRPEAERVDVVSPSSYGVSIVDESSSGPSGVVRGITRHMRNESRDD